MIRTLAGEPAGKTMLPLESFTSLVIVAAIWSPILLLRDETESLIVAEILVPLLSVRTPSTLGPWAEAVAATPSANTVASNAVFISLLRATVWCAVEDPIPAYTARPAGIVPFTR